MHAFGAYVDRLEQLLNRAATRSLTPDVSDLIAAALDGQPSEELRRVIDIESQRSDGAFFTGSVLAQKAVAAALPTLNEHSIIADPACGAGDLLVAVARHLPTAKDLESTLEDWSRRFMGKDLHPEFVRACQIRLALAAISRGRISCQPHFTLKDKLFPFVNTGTGLTDTSMLACATHIVINPPFTLVQAPKNCRWASGTVSMAALFMERCATLSNAGTRIIAILPDVLRSGERYRNWRCQIDRHVQIQGIQLLGQFDRWADVDVFILQGIVTTPESGSILTGSTVRWKLPAATGESTLGDQFDISVGPVVPYRDPKVGPRCRYIHPRVLPAWKTSSGPEEYRRFGGNLHYPPFAVVRRTSRLGDRHRAVATIIVGDGPVAVENHLLVLVPKRGGLRTCRRLLGLLKSAATTDWLNQRIRCRHLTTAALRDLPWQEVD